MGKSNRKSHRKADADQAPSPNLLACHDLSYVAAWRRVDSVVVARPTWSAMDQPGSYGGPPRVGRQCETSDVTAKPRTSVAPCAAGNLGRHSCASPEFLVIQELWTIVTSEAPSDVTPCRAG